MGFLATIDPEPTLPGTDVSLLFIVIVAALVAAAIWIQRKPVP